MMVTDSDKDKCANRYKQRKKNWLIRHKLRPNPKINVKQPFVGQNSHNFLDLQSMDITLYVKQHKILTQQQESNIQFLTQYSQESSQSATEIMNLQATKFRIGSYQTLANYRNRGQRCTNKRERTNNSIKDYQQCKPKLYNDFIADNNLPNLSQFQPAQDISYCKSIIHLGPKNKKYYQNGSGSTDLQSKKMVRVNHSLDMQRKKMLLFRKNQRVRHESQQKQEARSVRTMDMKLQVPVTGDKEKQLNYWVKLLQKNEKTHKNISKWFQTQYKVQQDPNKTQYRANKRMNVGQVPSKPDPELYKFTQSCILKNKSMKIDKKIIKIINNRF